MGFKLVSDTGTASGGIILKEDSEGARKELLIFVQPQIISDEDETIYQLPAPSETHESRD